MEITRRLLAMALAFGVAGATTGWAATVEEAVVGTIAADAKYVLSPLGTHFAVVAGKGSRISVIVDGVAGPKFDSIVEPTMGCIDPRPYQSLDPNTVPRPAPVTFSRDGRRYAYVGRLGQEWVLMVDNKEMLRLPAAGAVGASSGIAGSVGNTELRLEFSGDDGKHLLFSRSVYGGNELWVDGQKWPGFYQALGNGIQSTEPLISADGTRIAYPASLDVRGEKQTVIMNGKDLGFTGEQFQYSPDGKHLLCVAREPKGMAVLVDGKSFFTAKEILRVDVPPAGNRLIFVVSHFGKDGNTREGVFLTVDGRPVEATLTHGGTPPRVVFSPDGKRYATVCGDPPNRFVVLDGKKGQEYFNVNDHDLAGLSQGLAFSGDSSRLVYEASTNKQGVHDFVVINEEESDALQNPWFRFSDDGKHVAYGGARDQAQQKNLLMIDGKAQPLAPGWFAQGFTFSPDGSHYAYLGQQGGNKAIFLDGKSLELAGDFAFSPDSQHFAVVGFRPADNKAGLFVDGQLVSETYDKPINRQAFTPDGKHLFWMAREPAGGTKAAPGVYENVVYLDGAAVTRFDGFGPAQGPLENNLSRFGMVSWKTPPAWSVNAAGALVCFGPVDDNVKRFTVTPGNDTTIETMIAEAKAAPARAAAKAAEEKKKADEAAAAKRAKATADAAAAAAKAKADYDAVLAQRKADYDAALAKRKADYDAAVAKKKADYDAAVAARAELLKQQQQKK